MAGMQVSYVLHSLFCVLFPRLITPRLFIVSIRLYRRFLQCPGSQAARPPPPVTMVTTLTTRPSPSRLSTPESHNSHMTCFLKTCKESFKHKALYYSNPRPVDGDPWRNSSPS